MSSNYRPPAPATPKHSNKAKKGYARQPVRRWDKEYKPPENRERVVGGVYRA